MKLCDSVLQIHAPILKALSRLVEDDELYLVGGAVRDLVLGREILDLDFAVRGSGLVFASRVAAALKGAFVSLSQDDDEARVVLKKELILDFRGFESSLIEDLRMRDFTYNSMAIPVKALLEGKDVSCIDPFSGINDIEKKIVRAVGPDSIKSDPLRILRAYRFAAQLGFEVYPSLECEAETISLQSVARERISYELLLILGCYQAYPVLNRLVLTGLMEQIFPFSEFWADYSVRSHSLAVFSALERILVKKNFPPLIRKKIEELTADRRKVALLKLAALFHDVAKPETRTTNEDGSMHFYGHDTRGAKKMHVTLLKALRFSKQDAEYVEHVISRHMHLHLLATAPELTERAMRRFTRLCGDATVDIMALDIADGFATAGRTRHLEDTVAKILELAAEDAKRASFKALVNGNDLIAMGLEPGPLFKLILGDLEELQWERKIDSKEEGLALVREKLARGEYQLPQKPE